MAEYGTRLPFYAAGILGFLAAILSFTLLKEPSRAVDDTEAASSILGSAKRIFSPLYFIAFMIILSYHLALLRLNLCSVCSCIISLDSRRRILRLSLRVVAL